MSNEKDPISLLERAVIATEREPTAEEIAAWEAEKAAAVAAREKHAAHMDRAEERANASLAIDERQAAALERIAVAVEALSAVLTAKPVVIPAQPRHDVVIGPGREPWGISAPFDNAVPAQNLGEIKLDPKRTR